MQIGALKLYRSAISHYKNNNRAAIARYRWEKYMLFSQQTERINKVFHTIRILQQFFFFVSFGIAEKRAAATHDFTFWIALLFSLYFTCSIQLFLFGFHTFSLPPILQLFGVVVLVFHERNFMKMLIPYLVELEKLLHISIIVQLMN